MDLTRVPEGRSERFVAGYAEDEPLLAWTRQSRAFERYARGRTVYYLRCPNRRMQPSLEERLDEIAAQLDQRREGSVPIIVIDHSREGPGLIERYMDAFATFCQQLSFPASNLVYASQNRLGPAQLSTYAEDRFPTIPCRWLIFDHHLQQTIDFQQSVKGRAVPPTGVDLQYTFFCMNRRPRGHRLVLLALLASPPFRELTHASFNDLGEAALNKALEDLAEGFPDWLPSVKAWLEGPAVFSEGLPGEEQRPYQEWLYDAPVELAARAALSVVTETHFSNGATRRVTEKSLKPVICGHPFVILGEPGSLALLESWGFDVDFAGIDRRYDEIEDPTERLNAVVETLRKLAHPPESAAIRTVVQANLERCAFNHRHLVDGLRPRLYAEAERCVQGWN